MGEGGIEFSAHQAILRVPHNVGAEISCKPTASDSSIADPLHMRGLNTGNDCELLSTLFAVKRKGKLTTKLPKPLDILVSHDLRMLNSRTRCSHVDASKRLL